MFGGGKKELDQIELGKCSKKFVGSETPGNVLEIKLMYNQPV